MSGLSLISYWGSTNVTWICLVLWGEAANTFFSDLIWLAVYL